MAKFKPVEPGDRFGVLTIIESAGVTRRPNGNIWRRLWACLCDCGNTVTARQDQLRTGKTKSCGHLSINGGTNPRWTGEHVSYYAMHLRISRVRGVAAKHFCMDCSERAQHWSYLRGCPEERYPIDDYCRKRRVRSPFCPHIEHYVPRCADCHSHMDRGPIGSVRRARTMLLVGAVA